MGLHCGAQRDCNALKMRRRRQKRGGCDILNPKTGQQTKADLDTLALEWSGPNYPRADYLSSSRKRLAPQLLYKGGIFKQWHKKQAVALHKAFYATLPELPAIAPQEADIA